MRKNLASDPLAGLVQLISFTGIPPIIGQYLMWLSQLRTNPVAESATARKVFEQYIPSVLRIYRPILDFVELSHLQRLVPILNEVVGTFGGSCPYPESRDTENCVRDYKALKQSLFKEGLYPEWMRFTPRSDKLFKWCYVMIKRLVISPMMELVENKQRLEMENRILHLVMKIVHLDTKIDDLADVLHDEELVALCNKMITVPLAELDTVIKDISERLGQYKGGIFKTYFENTAALWKEVLTELSELCGPTSETDPLMVKFRKDMADLMESMKFSVIINQRRALPPLIEMEEKLSPNMMVRIIFDVSRIVLRNRGIDFPSTLAASFVEFETTLQALFRLSNNIATREREVGERDMTNMIFAIAQRAINGNYLQWLETHPERTFKDYISSEKVVNGESAHFYWASFGDLFSLNEQREISEIIRKIQDILNRNHVILDGEVGDIRQFIASVRPTLKSTVLPSTESEALLHALDQLESMTVLEDKKTAVLCKFLLQRSVMGDFYAYWCEKCRTLDKLIADGVSRAPQTWGSSEPYKRCLEQYRENNILFLLSYLVFSMEKGAT